MNRTRSAMTTITGIAVAGVLSIAASAQKPPSTHTKWTAETVLPLTCAQAWVSSGKSYAGILSIVQTEARISLANRSLTFPNTREAGQEAGKGIAEDCKSDPNALLFAIVDKQVRRIAEPTTGTGN